MFTLSYSNDYHDSAWKKRKKYILHYKTWQWYSYKNHTIKLQCLRHEMHLFYIHYLQLQREITKLSIGFPILVSLTIPHNTHASVISVRHAHSREHAYDLKHTHTCLSDVYKPQTHTRCSHMECCEGKYVFRMLVLKQKFIWLVVSLAKYHMHILKLHSEVKTKTFTGIRYV